jgi:hypothetical protein
MDEPRDIDNPQPGFWAMRLVRGGPEVGAAIIRRGYAPETDAPDARMECTPRLEAFIDGREVPVHEVWVRHGRAITESEYRFLVADSEWIKRNAPNDPKAHPHKPVDFNKLHIRF